MRSSVVAYRAEHHVELVERSPSSPTWHDGGGRRGTRLGLPEAGFGPSTTSPWIDHQLSPEASVGNAWILTPCQR